MPALARAYAILTKGSRDAAARRHLTGNAGQAVFYSCIFVFLAALVITSIIIVIVSL
jgi:hypothetical protein